MNIGQSVLGTYRTSYQHHSGKEGVFTFVDTRHTGVIDSKRMPLGWYWVVFSTPEGSVRQMNHECEIGGDLRKCVTPAERYAAVVSQAHLHFSTNGTMELEHGGIPACVVDVLRRK